MIVSRSVFNEPEESGGKGGRILPRASSRKGRRKLLTQFTTLVSDHVPHPARPTTTTTTATAESTTPTVHTDTNHNSICADVVAGRTYGANWVRFRKSGTVSRVYTVL